MKIHIHLIDKRGRSTRGETLSTEKDLKLGDVIISTEKPDKKHIYVVCYSDIIQISLDQKHIPLLINSVLEMEMVSPSNDTICLHLKHPPRFINNLIRFKDKADLYNELLAGINLKYKIELV